MIIKSLSRKHRSFDQLIGYMEKEQGHRAIYHNFYGSDSMNRKDIIKEFMDNSQRLPKRKNGNYLYHDIISFEARHDLDDERVNEILIEIGELYLQEKAPKQLAFANIHTDTKYMHMHFCISANEVDDDRRKRLDKAKFASIQKNLESYVIEKYPELKQSIIYNKTLNKEKVKTTNNEQERKNRTGKLSKKEETKNMFHGIFEQANSIEELKNLLEINGFEIYERGKSPGILDTDNKRKYRLKTLGLIPHYEALKMRLTSETVKDKSDNKETDLDRIFKKKRQEKSR